MAEITAEFICDDILVIAECEVTGTLIPADFHHDIDDNREVNAQTIQCFGEDGEKVIPSDEFLNGIYKKIDANFTDIYNAAFNGKDSILI